MTEFLPKDVTDGLAAASRNRAATRVVSGDTSVPIFRFRDGGFSLVEDGTTRLRGRVDLYDGTRHLGRYLIVAVGSAEGETRYEIKRRDLPHDGPPVDFECNVPEDRDPSEICTNV